MTIYDELKKDHELVKSLLDRLSEAETADARRSLIAEIRDNLVPHSRAEEAVFYNTLRDLDESKDLVMHSYQEHLKAETLLRGLQVSEAVAMNWKSGVQKLKDDIAHHIQEEEGRVFTAARRIFSDEDARMLGKAFTELKPQIGAGVLSSNVELMANLMPERFRKSFVDHLQRGEGATIRKTG